MESVKPKAGALLVFGWNSGVTTWLAVILCYADEADGIFCVLVDGLIVSLHEDNYEACLLEAQ